MNKFYKVILSIATICFVLGIIICVIVGITGGWNFVRNGFHYNYDWDWDWNWDGSRNRNDSQYEYEDISMDFDNDIKSMIIDIPYGEVTIKKGNSFAVNASNIIEDSLYPIEVDDGVLKIKQDYEDESSFRIFGIKIDGLYFDNWKHVPTFEITFPEDFIAEKFNFDIEAGRLDISDLNTEYTYIKLGAGDFEMNNFSADKINIDGGVGSLRFGNAKLNDIDINSGAGEIRIQGVVTGSNRISTGVGDIRLDLDRDEGDYYIECNPGVGEVRLNDERIRSSYGMEGAKNSFNIDTGVGEVRIQID